MNAPTPSVETVLLKAVEIASPAERQAFVEQACSGDAALQLRVERLIANHFQAGSFLERPAAAIDPAKTSDWQTVGGASGPGTIIGPYKLMELIGEGGMGLVYVAEQSHPIKRRLALKIIKPGMDSRQVVARFEAERQALAMMDHANIAKVHDGGATPEGRPFFVMELVKGTPITDYCDTHRLNTRQRLELFLDVCHAVQHAHQKGIIHRDLKPSNVLVSHHDITPVVKVIDFGIAKATSGQLTDKTLYTAFTQMIGTPLYMSPEQAGLSDLDVDTRSDVYSLGVNLYELLTGMTPFDNETLKKAGYDEMRRIIREDEPPRPSTRLSTLAKANLSTLAERRGADPRRLTQSVRGELDWIVMKAMDKDRSRRYESASALAGDVDRYLHDLPVEALPPSAVYRLRKFARRNKAAVVSTALIAAALLLGMAASTWKYFDEREALREVDSQRQRAEDNFSEAGRAQGEAVRAKKVAEQERDAAYQNLYYADMRLGLVDWNAGNLARLTQKLRSYVPETGRDDLRGWEWYYFLSLCHQDERTLLEHRNLVTAVAWSPNGRYLASTSYDGTTKLWDAASWRLLQTFEGPKYLKMGVSWSPDSQSLAWGAAAEDSGVYVYQVPNGRLQTLRGHTSSVWTTAWSPDGKKLASAGIDQTLRIWEVASGSCLHVLKGFRSNIPSLAWHPDGIMLATAADEGLRIWDTVSGKIVRDTFTPSTGLVPWGSVAWSPDGRLLALAEQKCVVYRTADWSVATQWDAGQASCVVWKPDGKRLAAAGADGLIRIWDLAGPTCELTLRGHVKGVWSLTWEPSGRRLASGGMDATVKIWPVPPVPQPRCLDGRPGRGLQAIAWCEERDMLRSWDAVNGSIVLWNVATGERVSETPAPPGEAARFSSNGGLLAVADKAKEAARLLVCAARPGTPIQKINANVSRARKEWGTCLIGGRPFSPDASRLAFVSAPSAQEVEAVEIADLRGNEVLFHWGCVWPLAVSWSPKGRFLAIAGGGDVNDGGYLAYSGWIHVLDPEKRQRIWKLRHGTQRVLATALTWSPNDDALVSGDENGLAEVWDMGTGSKRVSTHLHTAKITSLAWSPGGPRVASGSADRTVRIWDPIRGEELLRFDLHAAVEQVEWSSDGCRLAAVDSDGKIHIWDASVGYRYVQSEAYSADQAHAANLKLK